MVAMRKEQTEEAKQCKPKNAKTRHRTNEVQGTPVLCR
jgi:hypothetical protein